MDKLKRQRELRKANDNAYTKKYEKTKPGFLMRMYRNMQSRVTGVQHLKHHLYEGLELLPRGKFYGWANCNPIFHKLFDTWEKSGYDRKLTPSVDRIDPNKGYVISNMEFVTHSENSRRGALNGPKTPVIQMDLSGKKIKVWPTMSMAAKSLGKKESAICYCCQGRPHHLTAYGFKWAYA